MDQIDLALKILKDGGVIAYPTDTTYGIGCDIGNRNAVEKIFSIKGRDFNKPLSIACSDLTMAKAYGVFTDIPDEFLASVYPGPVTLLVDKTDLVSDQVTAGSPYVGIRIPDHPEILDLIKQLGRPIITTSANISGENDAVSADEIVLPVDFIFRGECRYKQPSTIIDLKNKKILRLGAKAEYYQKLIEKF